MGTASPWADVETILLLVDLLTDLGLEGLVVKLNSVGDGTCRPAYQEKLREILTPRRAELCADCQERLDRNPLRVLDCKVPSCREIVKGLPPMLDFLCDACRAHFETVKSGVTAAGVRYEIDPGLVRGLDYTPGLPTRSASRQARRAIGGGRGGRYDGLIHEARGARGAGGGFSMGTSARCWQWKKGRTPTTESVAIYPARGAGWRRRGGGGGAAAA